MRIHIENLNFECIIGLLDFERDSVQIVNINLWADYKYTNDDFLNYATVVEIIKNDMIANKYILLEDALEKIIALITKKYPLITKLNLQISKPNILPDCKVGVSSLWTQ